MKRRIKIVFCLIFTLIIGTTTVLGTNFSDIDNHWAKEVVTEMAKKGIVNGYEDGTFKPNKSVTREEFAKILVETLEIKENDSNINYEDVEANRWSSDYIKIASKYLTGYKVGEKYYFKPTEASVREDIAVAVVMACGLENEKPDYEVLNNFSDEDKISKNLRKYIAIAVEHEIMRGKGGYFDPKETLTRAEVSQLLYNVFEKIVIGDLENKEEHKCEIETTEYEKSSDKKHKKIGICKCGEELTITTEMHKFTNGKCICGFKENVEEHKCTVKSVEHIEYKVSSDKNNHLVLEICECGKEFRRTTEKHNFVGGKCKCGQLEKVKEENVVIYGDVNEDGIVNFADGNLIVDYMNNKLEKTINFRNADVNLDGKLDEADQFLIYMCYYKKVVLPHKCYKITKEYKPQDGEMHQQKEFCECGKVVDITYTSHWFKNGKCICGQQDDITGTIYEKAVKELIDLEILQLYPNGYYWPNNKVTRAEFTKYLVIANGVSEGKKVTLSREKTIYSDVSAERWDSGYIKIATEKGFIEGYKDGTFAPDEPITYEDAIVFVVRALGYKNVIELKGTYPQNYITKAQELDLLDDVGYSSDKAEVTRGNMAIIIYNMLNTPKFKALIGDLNLNNKVDEIDVKVIRDYLNGESIEIDENIADVNRDEYVNLLDELILNAYVNGKIKILPHECQDINSEYENITESTHTRKLICNCGVVLQEKRQKHNFDDGECICNYREEEEEGITDVAGTVYEEAVEYLCELGIINLYEDGTYQPNYRVSKAEFAKILIIAEELEPAADVARGNTIYTDVDENHWASGYINVATQYGFIRGNSDGTFGPEDSITYEEAAVFVVSTLGYKNIVETNGTYPTNYITMAQQLNLFDDVEYASYKSEVTRGNMAIIIYNMLNTSKFEY